MTKGKQPSSADLTPRQLAERAAASRATYDACLTGAATPRPAPVASAPKTPLPPGVYLRRAPGGSATLAAVGGGTPVVRPVDPPKPVKADKPKPEKRAAAVSIDEARTALTAARHGTGKADSKMAKRLAAAAQVLARAGGTTNDSPELDRRIAVTAAALDMVQGFREKADDLTKAGVDAEYLQLHADRLAAEAPNLWRRADPTLVLDQFADSARQADDERRRLDRYEAPGAATVNVGNKGRGLNKRGLSMYGTVHDGSGSYVQRHMRETRVYPRGY